MAYYISNYQRNVCIIHTHGCNILIDTSESLNPLNTLYITRKYKYALLISNDLTDKGQAYIRKYI